jgi:hypothetical protein
LDAPRKHSDIGIVDRDASANRVIEAQPSWSVLLKLKRGGFGTDVVGKGADHLHASPPDCEHDPRSLSFTCQSPISEKGVPMSAKCQKTTFELGQFFA